MTIAVGAKYPWGDLSRLLPSGTSISEAIILASDSRFSRRLPSGPFFPSSNSGTKLFKLGRDVAAVYAGISRIGELCIDELRWKLSKQRNPNSTKSRELAQDTLKTTYRHHIALERLHPDEAPLYILIGACSKLGKAELYQFSHNNEFAPLPTAGLKAIGHPETTNTFYQLIQDDLNKKVEEQLNLRQKYPQIPFEHWSPMPIKAEHIAILISAALSRIIESGSDHTVGGKIQCAVITNKGIILPEISYSTDPTNKGPGWTRVTTKPKELVTVTGISGTFGFHSLSD
jgi:hypothetical protein